jgi:SAM-dependent methyltransferase
MTPLPNPYDELPYTCFPIEWTAPERLVLASLLHGGPRTRLDGYRVLELGCGNGANLLPLAYFRRQATFVGVDGAQSQIEVAQSRRAALQLSNVEFIHADFLKASDRLNGQFDFIIAHGVFSWVPHEVRDAMLEIFAQHLRRGGLLYLNYNTRPGWNVRGLVREFLLAQTGGETRLRARAQLAREVASKVVSALTGVEHNYSRLLGNEFRFVCEGDVTWIGHEFLSPDNHPYWRSEFLELAQRHHLKYVADADFNYPSGRVPEELAPRLDVEQLTGRSIEDTIDLLCYRQLHSPILTLSPWTKRLPDHTEIGELLVASCLEPCPSSDGSANPRFKHPSGYEVEAMEECIEAALMKLQPRWPRGLPVKEVFPDTGRLEDDLKLLQRNGLIELRCVEAEDFGIDGSALNKLELGWGGYLTLPSHRVSSVESGMLRV